MAVVSDGCWAHCELCCLGELSLGALSRAVLHTKPNLGPLGKSQPTTLWSGRKSLPQRSHSLYLPQRCALHTFLKRASCLKIVIDMNNAWYYLPSEPNGETQHIVRTLHYFIIGRGIHCCTLLVTNTLFHILGLPGAWMLSPFLVLLWVFYFLITFYTESGEVVHLNEHKADLVLDKSG